jgi:hypothetical protein
MSGIKLLLLLSVGLEYLLIVFDSASAGGRQAGKCYNFGMNNMYVFVQHIRLYTVQYGTAFPLQAWTGLESSRRLVLPDFKALAT